MTDTRESFREGAGAGEWHIDEPLHGGWFVLKGHDGAIGFEVSTSESATIATRHLNAHEHTIAELRTEVESLSISYEALDVDNKAMRAEVERLRQERDTAEAASDEAITNLARVSKAEYERGLQESQAELATMRERAALAEKRVREYMEFIYQHAGIETADAVAYQAVAQAVLDALTQGGEG